MKYLISVIRPYISQLLLAVLLSGLSLASAVGLLATSAWLISMASTRPPILVLEVAIVGVRFFGLSRGVVRYGSRVLEHDVALKIQSALRQRIFQGVSSQLREKFVELTRGLILNRILSDVEKIQDLWLRLGLPWLSALISGTAGTSIIYWLYPQLGVLVGAIFAFTALTLPILSSLGGVTVSQRKVEAEIFDQITQSFDSANEALIFSFGTKLLNNIDFLEAEKISVEKRKSQRSGLASSVGILATGSSVLLGIYFGSKGNHIAGVNIAVVVLLPLAIFEGLVAAAPSFSLFPESKASAEALSELLVPAERKSKEFNNQFSDYSLKLVNVEPLHSGITIMPISCDLHLGDKLMITGKSGSGKSSLIDSILGFLPFRGEMSLGGRKLPLQNLDLFSVLLQEDYLFATSIRENLRIGKINASEGDFAEVLDLVELSEIVGRLPDGIDTLIGENGYNFSGGERQRLKLARLLLRDTPIYLLDEPLEFLDEAQASRIGRKIFERLELKTVLLVSHLPLADSFGIPLTVIRMDTAEV